MYWDAALQWKAVISCVLSQPLLHVVDGVPGSKRLQNLTLFVKFPLGNQLQPWYG